MSQTELLQLVSIASTVFIGIGFIWAIKANTMVLTTRLDGVDRQIRAIEIDVKKMADVLVLMAEQGGRINLIEERLLAHGRRVDELERRFNKNLDDK